jgi:hypothetical protein
VIKILEKFISYFHGTKSFEGVSMAEIAKKKKKNPFK